MQEAHAQGEHEKRKPSEILAQLIHSWRYALWTLLILLAAALAFYFVWTEVNKKRAADSIVAAESVQKLYGQWESESAAEAKASLDTQLLAALDKIIRDYPRQYGAERGLLLRAEYYYQKKDWEKSAADYQELAKRFPESYMASMALFDAGVCLEQLGKTDEALALYQKVADQYKDTFVAPRALFDAGRISEQKSSFNQAKTYYDRLTTDFPQSEWTVLAKNRVIELKVAGKIQ